VQVTVGSVAMGSPVVRSVKPMSDAESLVRYHSVDEGDNAHNSVRIALPNAANSKHNIIQKVELLRGWRRQMAMPPRASDLWMANNDLRLHGRPAEYQLQMLAGAGESETGEVAHIYSFFAGLDVPEPNTREHTIAVSAAKKMDEAVEMLESALQANYEDVSVLEAINATSDLLFYGIEPDRGLDNLDLVLIRKMNLRDECGPASKYSIGTRKISDQLLCAMRITLALETELDQLCPKTFHWNDGCEGGLFRWRRPISRRNEEMTIQAIRDTVGMLLSAYPTHMEDDESLLTLSTMTNPRIRSAIQLRIREQALMQNVKALLEEMEEKLETQRYQIFEMPKWRAPLMIAPGEPPPIVEEVPIAELPVNFGDGNSHSVRVFQGQTLERAVTSFAAQHLIGQEDAEKLAAELHKRMPEDHPAAQLHYAISVALPSGAKTMAVYENETVGDAAAVFCQAWNVPKEGKLTLMQKVSKRLKKRAKQREILSIPVTAADGRKLSLRIMQGDQHNIFDAARNFVNAMVLPETAISQLVQAVETRLPKFAFNVPVTMPEPQPPLNMRVQEGDDPFEISVAFLAQNDLDEGEMLPKMVRVIQGKMRQLGMPVYMNHFLTRNAIIGD